jgi:hypothetical protein
MSERLRLVGDPKEPSLIEDSKEIDRQAIECFEDDDDYDHDDNEQCLAYRLGFMGGAYEHLRKLYVKLVIANRKRDQES